jgi:hypothetical protein
MFMNLRYFILTIAFAPSIAYTAEITPKKEGRTLKHQQSKPKQQESSLKKKESPSKQLKKHPKEESKAVLLDKPKPSLPRELSVSKDTAPVATYITSLTQPITFNGTTQSLYEWFKNREENKFGLTRIVEVQNNQARDRIFVEKGNVSLAKDTDKLNKMIAEQKAFYISNIEEKQSIQYGAIVCKEDLDRPVTQIAEDVAITTNYFLIWLINERYRELKKLEDEKIDKKKEELQDIKKIDQQSKKSKKSDDKKKEELMVVNAEFNAAASKALEALQ